jgi:bifunctional DNA-binding transcriptional regulator/antitoxin component of YhaV-PrlF toxin-antitoxin module
MISFIIMKIAKVTSGGQISIPSTIRRRWGTSTLRLDDLGDRIVLTPTPEDPIAAARGALAGEVGLTSEQLRAEARAAEAAAEERRLARS